MQNANDITIRLLIVDDSGENAESHRQHPAQQRHRGTPVAPAGCGRAGRC